ncbi:SDR family NAD(P)-dependent oxidoreductase [Bdellovibrionota bacterium]
MRLTEKVAIITGGGTGIGRATAIRFMEEGANVVIAGRRKEPLDEVVQEGRAISGSISAIRGDVSIDGDCKKIVAAAFDKFKRIDILVNNAGVSFRAPTHEMVEGEWHNVMNTNLTGAWLLSKAAIPHMLKAGGGSIVNVSSILGERGASEMAAYCASKGGLVLLTKSMATEYGPKNIRCNVVCPGLVETALTAKFRASKYAEESAKKYPLQRFGKPEEVANAILFFASDESRWITGANLDVDGGLMATPTG